VRAPVLTSAAEAWVTFVEERNFTHAAARLIISQPALNTKLRKFQREVGVPLYTRDGSMITITPDGEALAALIRDLMQRREEYLASLIPSPRRMSLVAGPGTYAHLLGPVIRETLAAAGAELSLAIKQGNLTCQAYWALPSHEDSPAAHLANCPICSIGAC
jgi:DNA-binding transcriptional LysR family regulator